MQTVTSAYVSEFNRDVNTKVNEHTGYDFGELVYVDYEGMDENPSNYYDIMAVYMVKYGVGDTATIMNDISKGWLQTVVNDMCSYTTSSGTKDVEETDADGNVTTVTKSVLYVNVTLKSYRDMISVYGFNSDQIEMLEHIMSPEFMGQLGYAGSGSGGGGGSPGVSSMTYVLLPFGLPPVRSVWLWNRVSIVPSSSTLSSVNAFSSCHTAVSAASSVTPGAGLPVIWNNPSSMMPDI